MINVLEIEINKKSDEIMCDGCSKTIEVEDKYTEVIFDVTNTVVCLCYDCTTELLHEIENL